MFQTIEPIFDIRLSGAEIPLNDELISHVEEIKKCVQPNMRVTGFKVPASEENEERRQALCQVLDSLLKTDIGRQVLVQVPADVCVLSLEPKGDDYQQVGALSWSSDLIINIFPENLFNKPYHEVINMAAHELLHVAHYLNEQDTLAELKEKGIDEPLTPYDRFYLNFWDEAGALIEGQIAGACFMKDAKRVDVSLEHLLRNGLYWQKHYVEAIEELGECADRQSALRPIHTKTFYGLQQAYFELHPELKWSKIVRHIHEGYKMMSGFIDEDLKQHPKQILSAKQFVQIYTPIAQYLKETAARLKV